MPLCIMKSDETFIGSDLVGIRFNMVSSVAETDDHLVCDHHQPDGS